MTSDVSGVKGASLQQAAMGRKGVTGEHSAPANNQGPRHSGTDEVEITESAARLQALEARLSELPVVDAHRVEAIRQAITDGRYHVDSTELAEKLIQIERLLNDVG